MTVDVSWIEAGLDEWEPGRWTIGNMIPAGYSCYLRVMHPAQRDGDGSFEEMTWREVAALSGRTLTALSRFADLVPDHDIGVAASPGATFLGDLLPLRLAEILQAHTQTPAQCTFLFGSYWAGFFPEGESMPAVTLADLRYLVAAGSCTQSCEFSVYPDAWWPADRRWVVVTPADSQSALVGCDTQTARHLETDPAIEAWPIKRSDSVTGL